MITPRTTRLVRTRGLRQFQRAISDLVVATDVSARRSCAVIVPTRAAASELRYTIEELTISRPKAKGQRPKESAGGSAIVLPMFVTRGELYSELHARLGGEPPLLSDFEREALLRRAAREVEGRGIAPPFEVRPGLIVEILRFYDELGRRHRTIDAFDRLMTDTLEPAVDYDRGAARLLQQTRFLAATFRAYQVAVDESGGIDEHALRAQALVEPTARPLGHVILTVGDEACGTGGLWPADFDLLSRLPALERIDVVATEEQLAAGFLQRVHERLPGIEEVRVDLPADPPPLLVAPPQAGHDVPPLYFETRDREEELVEIARALKARAVRPARFGVIFQRPLPYLYLARHVFSSAGIAYEAADALPLAAEPYAAALDAVFSAVASDFTRSSLVELLSAPQFGFGEDGARIGRREVAALDAVLLDTKYLGGRETLARLGEYPRHTPESKRALDTAVLLAEELDGIVAATSASQQFDELLAFLRRHERPSRADAPWRERHLRARAAILAALEGLRDAHRRFDDEPITFAEMSASVRRWIEGQTFSPRTGGGGLHLVDAAAARYASFDEARIVGLIETDWPPSVGRNIFYPGTLLTQLGWPAEPSRLASARAEFQDLLFLSRSRVSVSTFELEDDALVIRSTFLEDLDRPELRVERPPSPEPARVFVHEALAIEPVLPEAVDGVAREWLDTRLARAALDDRFHGAAGPQAPATFAVSAVERYLECPFKYFASVILKLDEEREDEPGMRATERGQFLHELLQQFFDAWQKEGHGAITPENVGRAVDLFRTMAEERLVSLSAFDRAVEEARLLGSAAAPGLAERLFAFEMERPVAVVGRLLEHPLEGSFEFVSGDRTRAVNVRAKADRIDLLDGGGLRIIDYKTGRAPKVGRALQLPIYGVCAAQHLGERSGGPWHVVEAGYVAFGEHDVFRSLATNATPLSQALADGQGRLLDAVEGIERGEFPPRPDEPFFCTTCAFASVCRKDYVGDE